MTDTNIDSKRAEAAGDHIHATEGTSSVTVLFVAGADFFSGAERALLLTLRALDPRRYKPVVIVGRAGELLAQLRTAGIPAVHVPLHRTDWRHPVAWARSVLSIARVARRVRARIIHSNEIPSFQPAGRAARLLGIPAITHARFPDELDAAAWFLNPGFDSALFVSRYLLDDAMAKAPMVFAARSEVLHDGVELSELPDEAARSAGRAALGLPSAVPAVAIAGQVAEIKGIWEFIAAAEQICLRSVPATFVVLGDDLKGQGRLRESVEERIRSAGLMDRFKFLGFRRDAPRLIPLFDIVAVPSHVEPLGNATLEAMAAGRPVVASRVGGIPEMVVHGETGLLVPPKSPDALASAIESLLRDPIRRDAFGAAGRRRARDVFGLERHAARLQEVYDRALSTPAGACAMKQAL